MTESSIVSDPGVGVLKAGWHCGGPPDASGLRMLVRDLFVVRRGLRVCSRSVVQRRSGRSAKLRGG